MERTVRTLSPVEPSGVLVPAFRVTQYCFSFSSFFAEIVAAPLLGFRVAWERFLCCVFCALLGVPSVLGWLTCAFGGYCVIFFVFRFSLLLPRPMSYG